MLNELIDLYGMMKAAGIRGESWCKGYEECPKRKTLFLMIAPGGKVVGLEPVKDVVGRGLRTYIALRNFSFPGFNVKPLLAASSDTAKEAATNLKKLFRMTGRPVDTSDLHARFGRLWDVCESRWTPGEKKRIKKCLESAGLTERLGDSVSLIPQEFRAIAELVSRAARIEVNELHEALKYLILDGLKTRPESVDYWIDLLVSSSSNPNVPVVLELADQSSFSFPANHSRVIKWVNETLMVQSERPPGKKSSTKADAFGWPIADQDMKEKFPPVKLPVVRNVILRAMNENIPCQKRYGHIDAESYPAGAAVRQAMKDALTWLRQDEHKGITWSDASGACGFTRGHGKRSSVPALFLVYPSSLSLTSPPPELAGVFFPADGTIDPDGARFESAARRVTSSLELKVKAEPHLDIRVFVLVKVDAARTKVLVSRRYDAQALISGATHWIEGCKNIPPIKLNVGLDNKPSWMKPMIPFPGEVVKCLNVAWLQEGKRTDHVHGLGIGEGLELLLASGAAARRVASRALSLLVKNGQSILLALAHTDHRRDGSLSLPSGNRRDANLLLSALGLLLYKHDLMKGAYMHTAPFLVGRLLSLADLLHKEYCLHVRKSEKMPPQLIGNSLMATAMDNPVRGVARLHERLRIYQAWAYTCGDHPKRVKWALKRMSISCGHLAALALPDHTKDADKAQMLLGYLARIEDAEPENSDYSAMIPHEEVSDVRSTKSRE